MATYVDSEAAIRGWVNALTTTLVGAGKPLPMGAHLHEMRGGAPASYARLSVISGSLAGGAENPDHRARISASIYGTNKEVATVAAVAYANALLALDGTPTAMTGAVCLICDPDTISGPLWSPDGAGARVLVDADFWLRAT